MPTAQQIRTIHTLRRACAMTEADYRGLLDGRFGVASSTDLSDLKACDLIDILRGAAPQPPRRRLDTASGKYAPILRALWIACYNLQIVVYKDDIALIAFCERQTGVNHPAFLTDARQAKSVIEALKAMAGRAGVAWPDSLDPVASKRAVCEAVARLAYKEGAFSVPGCSRLTGISRELIFPDDLLDFAAGHGFSFHARDWTGVQWDRLSASLGNRIRNHRAKAAQSKRGPSKTTPSWRAQRSNREASHDQP